MSTDQRTRPAIGDYAFLSDCNAAVFVDRWGSVDWWCLPRFDSPSVFGRLLDPDAGHWTLRPDGDDWTISRGYLRDSLVLATTWSRPGAEVRITEALALEPGARGHEIGKRTSHALLRRVEGIRGSVAFCSEFRPRFEYGLNRPRLARDGDLLTAEAGAVSLTLVADVPFEIAEREECATARFVVQPATTLDFRLSYSPAYGPDLRESGTAQSVSVDDTVEGWRSWMEPHQAYHGPYRDLVRRSALVLKGLTYERSGALLAAATTSLPEKLGGEANWDYRLAWLRDASLMMRAQWVAACPEEAERYFAWIARAVGRDHRQTPIVYGVEGERDLTERELPHLAGYRDSRPVRIGNDAWRQTQLDVYGHVLDAACLLRERLGPGPLDEDVSRMLADFADRAAE
ncbi:MAG: glycoside hydrolase family 15 protein, partial [Chloroflexi bacterium]|nr:glycoside hydrolase family 15 protein [Chloroflexota bacterium]